MDIETANWTRFLVAGAFDGETYWHARALSRFLESLAANGHARVWYAHFGGQFDFLFFLQAMLRHRSVWRLRGLIPRGSRLLSMDVEHLESGRVLTFRDSGALLPFSLRRLAEQFGVAHQKLEIDYSKITRVTPELLTYLEHDCRGLHEILTRYAADPLIARAGMRSTMASQALAVFRTTIQAPIPALTPAMDGRIRPAYAGGRVEIFRPYFRGPGKLHCYDVNSLYPAVMLAAERVPGRFLEVEPFPRPDYSRLGFFEGEVEVRPDVDLPVLWTRGKKFLFPTGHLSGIWPAVEIQRASELGQIRAARWRRFYSFGDLGSVFRAYISELYERRRNATSDVERVIVKLLMNSLYGRLGLRRDREGLALDDGQLGVTPDWEIRLGGNTFRFAREPKEIQTFSNVAIAAWITALARLKLHDHLRAGGVYYCDTDSLFTTKTLPTSDALGALKLEYSVAEACFLLPKTYVAGTKVVMKGFDAKKTQGFKFADFEAALEGDLRILRQETPPKFAKLKSALKSGKLVTMTKASERRIRSKYDKRILLRDASGEWSSRPVHLKPLELQRKRDQNEAHQIDGRNPFDS